jgi:hypothetical protein
MKVEDIKGYEARVISTKKDAKGNTVQIDPTIAQPIADDPAGHYTKDRCYYHLQLLAPKVNGMRDQKGAITLNVFNSNDQIILFNDIADTIALGEGVGYTKASNGDLIMNKSQLAIPGAVFEEKCFKYKVMSRNSKGVLEQMTAWKKNDKGVPVATPATRSVIKVFVHAEEDPDVRIAIEMDRVRPHKCEEAPATANNGDVDLNNGTE